MLKIGITGGIGSGKTTVCHAFEILGIPVFYADTAAKEVMITDHILMDGVLAAFGKQSYDAGKQLNRKYLANIVFNDSHQLEKLNALVHPAVFRAFHKWLINKVNYPYVLKEAALLFESGSYKLCDKNVLVTAPSELKIQRVIKRDKINATQVYARMDKQLTDEEKLKFADYVIGNDEKTLLFLQVIKLHEQFLSFNTV